MTGVVGIHLVKTFLGGIYAKAKNGEEYEPQEVFDEMVYGFFEDGKSRGPSSNNMTEYSESEESNKTSKRDCC